MWPSRRFADLVGIRHPIVQAPMAGSCTPALAAAVCAEGALGSLGLGPRNLDVAQARIEALRGLTHAPFNLNFFAHQGPSPQLEDIEAARAAIAPEYRAVGQAAPSAAEIAETARALTEGFTAARLAMLMAVRPAVASFHFGLPTTAQIAELRAGGICMGATATTVAEAQAVVAAGAQFVVARGFEAGGHHGAHDWTAPDGGAGLMALIQQVRDAVALPIVAAGGIADARGIAAAFALGADGVQMGAAFLGAPETEIGTAYRLRLAAARDDDTLATHAVSGRSNRVGASAFTRRARGMAAHPPFPLQYALSGPLQAAGGDAYDAPQHGQAAALSRAAPARDILRDLIAESAALLKKLGRGLP